MRIIDSLHIGIIHAPIFHSVELSNLLDVGYDQFIHKWHQVTNRHLCAVEQAALMGGQYEIMAEIFTKLYDRIIPN